jgi:hypothetical protein
MSGLNLSTEEKDIYFLAADPWGDFEIKSENLIYGTIGNFEGMQCRNNENHKEILKRCGKIVKLIEEIEQLNKP